MIGESVAHLRAAGREVVYDAEHFFDGYKADAAYALATLRAAVDAGATTVVLCDTNGGCLTDEVAAMTRSVANEVGPGAALGIHVHDDAGLAVATSLAAVQAGATHVQGTINGYGERCGNANLVTIWANLALKIGLPDGARRRRPDAPAPSWRTSWPRSPTSPRTPTPRTSGPAPSRTRAASMAPPPCGSSRPTSTWTRRSSAARRGWWSASSAASANAAWRMRQLEPLAGRGHRPGRGVPPRQAARGRRRELRGSRCVLRPARPPPRRLTTWRRSGSSTSRSSSSAATAQPRAPRPASRSRSTARSCTPRPTATGRSTRSTWRCARRWPRSTPPSTRCTWSTTRCGSSTATRRPRRARG